MISIEQIRPQLTWKLRQEVLYPDKKITEMEMDEDADGVHFAAFKDNKLVGVVSLFQRGSDFQFRKFAVEPSAQKTGIGTQVLQHIIDYALQNGGSRIWCNARLSAINFYLRSGFVHTGHFFSKHGFDYEILEKSLTPAQDL